MWKWAQKAPNCHRCTKWCRDFAKQQSEMEGRRGNLVVVWETSSSLITIRFLCGDYISCLAKSRRLFRVRFLVRVRLSLSLLLTRCAPPPPQLPPRAAIKRLNSTNAHHNRELPSAGRPAVGSREPTTQTSSYSYKTVHSNTGHFSVLLVPNPNLASSSKQDQSASQPATRVVASFACSIIAAPSRPRLASDSVQFSSARESSPD